METIKQHIAGCLGPLETAICSTGLIATIALIAIVYSFRNPTETDMLPIAGFFFGAIVLFGLGVALGWKLGKDAADMDARAVAMRYADPRLMQGL